MNTYELNVELHDDGSIKVTKKCIQCQKVIDLGITSKEKLDELLRTVGYGHMQDLKWLSPGNREMFISGFCGECFNKIFSDTSEEE